MREFRVNEHISLKLEKKKTIIYVGGRQFHQCKFLLINIPKRIMRSFNDVESIDEAAERSYYHMEGDKKNFFNLEMILFQLFPNSSQAS